VSVLWSDPLFGPVAQELYRRCGLVFEGGQAHLFRKRIERRAEETGHADTAAYVAQLERGGAEVEYERLVEMLTVNETFFFREEEQFHLLLDEFWPRWVRRNEGPIRIWSAACSVGCEPYTLAMLLREKGLVGPGRPNVEIQGTDVNGRVLDEAKRGEYGEFSLRNTAEHYRRRYFRKTGHTYTLDPEIRRMVAFRRYNLLRPDGFTALRTVHAVLCRNVLIYFDLQAKRQAVGVLAQALCPGGVLLVGRTESLFNVPEAPPLMSVAGVIAHQKPEATSHTDPFGVSGRV
jgi:chemotaxis protein methyltransferase CheR